MAIMLPTEVAHFLQWFGFDWPEGNEDRVFEYAGHWQRFGDRCRAVTEGGMGAEDHVTQGNLGPAIDAFRKRFNTEDGPTRVAADMSVAGPIGSAMLYAMGGIIIALKIVVVVQLVQFAITLAEAIAAAVPTFGASMSIVPLAELIAQRAIEFAINMAAEALLGGS